MFMHDEFKLAERSFWHAASLELFKLKGFAKEQTT